ncbi:hypothetical protein [Streptomyces sp. MJP52]|uniref:hypothetical protein n=1 Tax=Streptomyces sp. MJP52 TaxID=2940555 RepID=UPI002474E04A|nr:hypothetical protein [Streptomyces sp. MJP52]MDH6226193.1 hypothetical protein [Streptomyces sp. MJP52]
MRHSTGDTTPVTIPHTAAEWDAMSALHQHVGSKVQPNCPPCVARIDGCATGRELRRAVRAATLQRLPQGARL